MRKVSYLFTKNMGFLGSEECLLQTETVFGPLTMFTGGMKKTVKSWGNGTASCGKCLSTLTTACKAVTWTQYLHWTLKWAKQWTFSRLSKTLTFCAYQNSVCSAQ